MAEETIFEVPAIVPGTPQLRDFARVFMDYPFRYRTRLGVDNRSSATVIVTINQTGKVRRVAAGKFLEFEDIVYNYQVDATAATSGSDVSVYENGGLDEREEATEAETEVQ